MANHDPKHDDAVLTESKQKLQKPPLFKVLIHNDNYTTMDFVVFVLVQVFGRSETDAIRVMLQVHNQGVGIAGVYTHEIAETKVARVEALAREHEFPLLCTMEEE
ncbi:MAG: ATP-dependent Clp protease adapter ClpS [Blastocatellia bacterium]